MAWPVVCAMTVVLLSIVTVSSETFLGFGAVLNDLSGQYVTGRDSVTAGQRTAVEAVLRSSIRPVEGDTVYGLLVREWGTEGVRGPAGVSETCTRDIASILGGLAITNQTWPLKMVDAAGKIGSGILDGNIYWLGSYDQCRKITATDPLNVTSVRFKGQYCHATLGLPGSKVSGGGGFGMPVGGIGIQLGVCAPNTCSESEVHSVIQSAFSILTNMSVVATHCSPDSLPLDTPAIVILCLLLVFVLLLMVATIYDIVLYQPITASNCDHVTSGGRDRESSGRHSPVEPSRGILRPDEYTPLLNNLPKGSTKGILEEPRQIGILGEILVKFSLYTNGAKLLSTAQTSNYMLGCVHGIRFISMTWVILGHATLFSIYIIRNLLQFPVYLERWSFQGIMNATVSVDTFFVLSGLLLSYLVLQEMKQRGGPRKINWLLFYFHRFWRLTPAYMLVLGIYTALFKYLGDGPLWPDGDMEASCRTTWWKNMLYINNLVSPGNSCMEWTWYLANDMQFFIISPLILIPLYLHFAAGFAVIMALLLTSFISTGVLSYLNNYPASTPAIFTAASSFLDYFKHLYIVPWTRIGPYLVGILIGYALYRTDRKVHLHKAIVIIGWAVAVASSLAVLYGLYDVANGKSLTPEVSAFYNTVHRTVWAAAVGWVIFACVTGYGGPVNSFLSWPCLIPLSRLTFMAYLIHPVVMVWFYFSQRVSLYYTDTLLVYLFLGHMVVSYGLAFMLSLAFEAPFIAMEKLIFKRQ